MAKQQNKRPRGRPPMEIKDRKGKQLSVRIDDDLSAALERYRTDNSLDELSDAVRHALRTILKDRGLLQ